MDWMLTRRRLFTHTAVLSAAGLAGVSISADAEAKKALGAKQIQDPQFNLRVLTRLQNDVSGKVQYGFQRGRVLGISEGKGLPLADYGRVMYDIEGGSVKMARVKEDGSVETRSRGWMFYKDPQTGAYLESYKNPLTGETVTVPPFRAGISGGTMTANGPVMSANFTMESIVFNKPIALGYNVMGDTVFVTRHAFTRWQPRGEPNAKTEMTYDTWTAKLDDVLNEKLTYIPNTSSWTSETEWQTWLKMPDTVKGHLIWRNDGRAFKSMDDLPQEFIDYANKTKPGILTDPLTWS
jgi:hypothetical protein